MNSVDDIKQAILSLSSADFRRLREWFLEQDWEAWNRQVEADLASGKLNSIIEEAEAEIREGKTLPL